jgi:hypothetical protein
VENKLPHFNTVFSFRVSLSPFFGGQIFTFVNSTNMILIQTKFLQQVPVCSQNIKGFLNYLLSSPVCSQIWLKVLVDDYQFQFFFFCLPFLFSFVMKLSHWRSFTRRFSHIWLYTSYASKF